MDYLHLMKLYNGKIERKQTDGQTDGRYQVH